MKAVHSWRTFFFFYHLCKPSSHIPHLSKKILSVTLRFLRQSGTFVTPLCNFQTLKLRLGTQVKISVWSSVLLPRFSPARIQANSCVPDPLHCEGREHLCLLKPFPLRSFFPVREKHILYYTYFLMTKAGHSMNFLFSTEK